MGYIPMAKLAISVSTTDSEDGKEGFTYWLVDTRLLFEGDPTPKQLIVTTSKGYDIGFQRIQAEAKARELIEEELSHG